MARRTLWSESEDKALINLWGDVSVDDISKIMDRHRLTILKKAKDLGLREGRSKKWSDEEIQYLKENYKSKNSCKMITKKLNRSERSVYTMAERLGVKIEWDYIREDKDGYVEIILGSSKKIKEHRLVYEKEHGFKLKPKEHIHHLDLNKKNNSIDNLIMLSPGQHNVLHSLIIKNDQSELNKFIVNLLEHDKPKYEKWLKSLTL